MTQETTMLERVARSFIVPLGHDPDRDWTRTYCGNGFEDGLDASLHFLCFDLARAAIEAMRTPDKAMVIGARDWSAVRFGKSIGNIAATGCWDAMITAALADTA